MNKYWFYMCSDTDVSVIKSAIDKSWSVEIWKEVSVLEITKGECCVDVELISTDHWDEFSKNFITDNGFSKVYTVTLGGGNEKDYSYLMQSVVNNIGGCFVADTDELDIVIK